MSIETDLKVLVGQNVIVDQEPGTPRYFRGLLEDLSGGYFSVADEIPENGETMAFSQIAVYRIIGNRILVEPDLNDSVVDEEDPPPYSETEIGGPPTFYRDPDEISGW